MNEGNFERALPTKVEKVGIEPVLLNTGETEIILQRHGMYERSEDSKRVGSLTKEGAKEVYEQGKDFFKKLFELVPESERHSLHALILASDTQYKDGGRRSMETANQVIRGLKEVLMDLNLDESQALNTSGNIHGEGGARPTPALREPQIFNDSPEFVEFLKEKYGDLTPDFWMAFEEDKEKYTREEMGAEGPDEITDRMQSILDTLARYSRFYHKKHPDRRLVIWAVTHYDTISPYVKREILKTSKDSLLEVEHGAGLVIKLDEEGAGTVRLGETEYEVPLKTRSSSNS